MHRQILEKLSVGKMLISSFQGEMAIPPKLYSSRIRFGCRSVDAKRSGTENRKNTPLWLPYGCAYVRRGDPGVVESPRGAVLGARWPFLILAQRHPKGNPQFSEASRRLKMLATSAMST